jgi:hypothetical protein
MRRQTKQKQPAQSAAVKSNEKAGSCTSDVSDDEKIRRREAFNRTRMIGFGSFIIPVSIILTMIYFSTSHT